MGLLKKIRCLLSQNTFGKNAAPTDFIYQELLWAQQHPDEELVNNAIWRAEVLGEIQTVEELNRITDQFPPLFKEWLERGVPRANFKDEKSWLESFKSQILDKLVQLRLVIIFEIESDKFRAAKAAKVRDLIAKKIALDEKLDACIDKAIKRLAQLKTFKQLVVERASHTRAIDHRSISDQG